MHESNDPRWRRPSWLFGMPVEHEPFIFPLPARRLCANTNCRKPLAAPTALPIRRPRMRSPAEHRIADLRTQVFQATEVAMQALQNFDSNVRTLAIRQLAVDVEIRSVAISLIERRPPRAEADPTPSSASEFTIDQVAERCHVSRDAVKKWLGRKDGLRKIKAGGRTLITEADLQDFLKRSTEKPRRSENSAAA